MHLSVFLGPLVARPSDDGNVIEYCIEAAIDAAHAGFAMVTFGEQHYNDYEPYTNPFMMASLLSRELDRTWFATTVVPLPFHAPLRLAEDAALADLLLGGRFILGLSHGRSGPVPDFANFGLDASERAAIVESKLDVLTAAFAHRLGDPPLVVDTPYDKGILNGRLMPSPWRAGGPLLALGSNTDTTITDAGRRGWPLFLGPCLPTIAAAKFALHRSSLAQAGFDADHVRATAARSLVTRNVIVAPTDDEAWELAERLSGKAFWMDRSRDERSMRQMNDVDLSTPQGLADPYLRNPMYVQSWLLVGSPETVARGLKEYEALDVPHVNVRFTSGLFSPEAMTRSYELFRDEVMPAIGAELFGQPDPSSARPPDAPRAAPSDHPAHRAPTPAAAASAPAPTARS